MLQPQPHTAVHDTAPPSIAQRDVIAWLATPSAYGAGTGVVERIDTHSSVIFLAGSRAYKLKRDVRYDYLDYSTSERRRACCFEEVRLNRRTAPMLYRGVRAVTREADGSLALDGTGPAVDWLVEMVRFDEESQLDRLADRHALDLRLMPRLADAIVRLHDLAEWRFDHGGQNGMVEIIRGNRAGFQQFGPGVFDAIACQRLTSDSFATLRRHADLLEARRHSGFVRWCHGDLHLGNVCLLNGLPTLFDCVEFNDAIACGDVLYDLAFLLMDLIHRGLGQHASTVFNHYLERAADTEGLPLLPLFLATRASVRAKTTATAAPAQTHAAEGARLRVEARRYLTLAQDLLIPRTARLVCVGGPSGSGKTTLAGQLASGIGPPPGAVILRSDSVRKQLLGVTPTTRLGPDGYTEGVNRLVYRTLIRRADAVLGAGHAVIVDAVFADPLDRAMLRDVARTRGVPFTGLWLDAPLSTLTARLQRRTDDVSDATPSVAARQVERGGGPDSWARLDASADAEGVRRAAQATIGVRA